jgi:hypothetical protein
VETWTAIHFAQLSLSYLELCCGGDILTRTQSTLSILLGFLFLTLAPADAQNNKDVQPASSQPPHKKIKPTTDGTVPIVSFPKKDLLPRCSTEKVNGDCYVNINRFYPYSYPGFMIKPKSSVTVNVFNPFGFEKLTLETSAPANIYEGTDQFGSLVTAISPGLKGTTIDGTTFHNMLADDINLNVANFTNLTPPPTQTASDLETKIKAEETDLKNLLDSAVTTYINPYTAYKNQTNEIYRQVRLVSLAAPRPVHDPDQRAIDQEVFEPELVKHPDQQGPCFSPSDPWHTYGTWRQCMIKDLLIQGNTGSILWSLFPNKCQAKDQPWGPWTVPTPTCNPAADTVEPSHGPQIDDSYQSKYTTLASDLAALAALHDPNSNYQKLKETADFLDQRHSYITSFLAGILGAVPATLTKISTDMQNFYIALLNAPPSDQPTKPINLGTVYGPSALDPTEKKVRKYLGVPIGLAPAITYNVNGQNLVTNTLLSAPATTQRTLVAAIPLTFANPRFETSAGVFLSFLNNRTFANTTDVAVTTTTTPTGPVQTPAPTDIKITETVTNKPLLIPYYAAHFRIAPEWIYPQWMGGRRGAFYLTGALGINPYQTDLEYAAGFGISWRYLMFSPVYHLGRSTHLTNLEQVGQIYCVYSTTATSMTTPPACVGSPPAPTTKNYLTGAFAIGIGVRIPTTFSSTNK